MDAFRHPIPFYDPRLEVEDLEFENQVMTRKSLDMCDDVPVSFADMVE